MTSLSDHGMTSIPGDRLRFTTHALIRYIERYVDPSAVQSLRRPDLDDRKLLAVLAQRFEPELREFKTAFSDLYERRSAQCRNVTSGVKYRLIWRKTRVVISADTCVTALPRASVWRIKMARRRECARRRVLSAN